MPIISNTAGIAVTLGMQNTVSGIHIFEPQTDGIFGENTGFARITNNFLENINLSGDATNFYAIYLKSGLSGTSVVSGNTLTQTHAKKVEGIVIEPNASDICSVYIQNNHIYTQGYGVYIHSQDSSNTTSIASGNTIHSTAQTGLLLEPKSFSQIYYTIDNNTISRTGGGGKAMEILTRDNSFVNGTVSNNHFVNSNIGFQFSTGGVVTSAYLTATANVFSANSTHDFYAHHPNGGDTSFMCVKVNDNLAPALGFVFENNSGTPGRINIASFTNNEGSATELGTGLITHNPTCE